MQTYTATATVEADHGLHLEDLPFSPGVRVEVNIMERESEATPADAGSRAEDLASVQRMPTVPEIDAERGALIRRQYKAAKQFPGEYVVLSGPDVMFHSRIRSEAFEAYDRVFDDSSTDRPVIVEPGRYEPPAGVFRGRTLTGQWPRLR